MTSSMLSDEKTTASETEETYEEKTVELTQTVGEKECVESKSTTEKETEEIKTVEEPKAVETCVTPETIASIISAEVIEDIAETIAANNCCVAYSVAATLGSSVDGESVRTEDFAGEEIFFEESRKAVDMDLVEGSGVQGETSTDTMTEGLKQVSSDSTTTERIESMAETEQIVGKNEGPEMGTGGNEMGTEISAISGVDNMSEMGYSVAATVGSSVDGGDSLGSLDDMIEGSNDDRDEKIKVAVEETSVVHSEASSCPDALIHVQTTASDDQAASTPHATEETAVVNTLKVESVDLTVKEASEEASSIKVTEPNGQSEASIQVKAANVEAMSKELAVKPNDTLVDTMNKVDSIIETESRDMSTMASTEITKESTSTCHIEVASTEPAVEVVKPTQVDAKSKVESTLETASQQVSTFQTTEVTDPFENNNGDVSIEGKEDKSTAAAGEETSRVTSNTAESTVVSTTETLTTSEHNEFRTGVEVDGNAERSSEAETCEKATDTSTKVSDASEAAHANATPSREVQEPEHEAENAAKTPKKLSSMISRITGKISKSPAKIKLNSEVSSPDNVEQHDSVTSSDTKVDLSEASPVQNVVHRFEGHQNDENPLESLKIRTKRDFFSEKERSISVSHEKEKYNTQMAQRAKKEADGKDFPAHSPAKKSSFASRTTSAMSSVRNMASRFEKKADQSLDNLSFRTVRSFFPTEKSVDVSAEKHKYEALEKEREATKETCSETRDSASDGAFAEDQPSPTKASLDSHGRRHTVTDSDSWKVRGIAHRFETKRANSIVTAPVRTIDTFIVADSEASVRVSAEKAKYENPVKTSAPTKRTIDTFIVPTSQASVRVSAEKAKFETPEKQVKVTKRTIDTFIVPKEEASVRVSAEKAKFEMPEKQAKATVRTIDTFIVPENEASVRVSAEKSKFEKPETLVKATVRTIDTFIVPENEASVRVSAEKAKFESPDKLVKATVRTIDTFIVPENEASVRVSVEKAKFESLEQQMQATGPAVRTIDTFIVPESEVSIRVAAEKAKLEALEKQKQSEMEAQAAIERQKLERAELLASEKAKLEEEVIRVASDTDAVTTADEVEEGEDSNNEIAGACEDTVGFQETEAKTEKAFETEISTHVSGEIELASESKVKETEGEQVTEDVKTEVFEQIEVKEDEVVSRIENEVVSEVTETEKEVIESKVVTSVEEMKDINETVSNEVHQVPSAPNSTGSEVEVTVERQTFGDVVSTAQHVHWLSLPVSVNPALARLHTVLSAHDPLTAYALYPSSPPSPTSRRRDA